MEKSVFDLKGKVIMYGNTPKQIYDKIGNIAKSFGAYDGLMSCTTIHSGHINRTYAIEFNDKNGKYQHRLIQMINTEVFKKPEELMDNVIRVTAFLKDKIAKNGGNPDRETLTVYYTDDGKNCFIDENGDYWRCYNFVEDAFSYDKIENDSLFFEAGAAFGNFQSQLADFPIETLFDTIPDFHNTHKRFEQMTDAAVKNAVGRIDSVRDELKFAYSRENETVVLTDLLEKGELPLRVTHNDTKLNNVMFDKKSGKAICVVDLDTVMPGLSLYDFGDAIRFGANTGAEDEKDLSRISLDLNLYEKYVKGYLSEAGKSLTDTEVKYLPFSAKLLTFECGMRFLADYLNGDVYFSIDRPEHNLDRCRTQFALVADIEKKYDEMVKITEEAYNSI